MLAYVFHFVIQCLQRFQYGLFLYEYILVARDYVSLSIKPVLWSANARVDAWMLPSLSQPQENVRWKIRACGRWCAGIVITQRLAFVWPWLKTEIKGPVFAECRGANVHWSGEAKREMLRYPRERPIPFTRQNTRLIGMALRQFPTITGEGGRVIETSAPQMVAQWTAK